MSTEKTIYLVILSIYIIIIGLLILFVSYNQCVNKGNKIGNNINFKIGACNGLNLFVQLILWSSLFAYIGFIVIWSYESETTEIICDIFYSLAFLSIFTLFWCTFLFWLFRLFYTFKDTNLSLSNKTKNIFLFIILFSYFILILGFFIFILGGIESDYKKDEDDNEIVDKTTCYSHGNVGVFICVGILVISIIGWNITFCTMYVVKHRKSIKHGILLNGGDEVELQTSTVDNDNDNDNNNNNKSNDELTYDIEKQVLITIIMVCSSFISWVLILGAPSLILELIGLADWVTNAVCVILLLPTSNNIYKSICGDCHQFCCKCCCKTNKEEHV